MPSARPAAGPAAAPTAHPTPIPTRTPACAVPQGRVNTTGVPDAAARTAAELHAAALACDTAALRARAERDRTQLSFGGATASQVFAEEGAQRADMLARLLTLRPATRTGGGMTVVQWPAPPKTDADWQALVDAGVVRAADQKAMRADASGYTGWRLGIDSTTGVWLWLLAGD